MLNMNWTMSAVMLAAAFGGIAPQASAQAQRYKGTFHLPVEARVGSAVLQPGSYTVSTIEGSKGIRIVGEGGKASILAAGYDLKPENERARLVFVDSDGMYALQSFESGSMGKAFHFSVRKNPRGGMERAATKPAIEVGLH